MLGTEKDSESFDRGGRKVLFDGVYIERLFFLLVLVENRPLRLRRDEVGAWFVEDRFFTWSIGILVFWRVLAARSFEDEIVSSWLLFAVRLNFELVFSIDFNRRRRIWLEFKDIIQYYLYEIYAKAVD